MRARAKTKEKGKRGEMLHLLIAISLFTALPCSAKEWNRAKLEQINRAYRRDIMPIFEQKCFDCHSSRTRFPFYYRIPLIHGFIDAQISRAQKTLDLSTEFPFGGHPVFSTDLHRIRHELDENQMPPVYYRFMHQNSTITSDERKLVFKWIEDSQALLMQR